jgi:hypothetical protein
MAVKKKGPGVRGARSLRNRTHNQQSSRTTKRRRRTQAFTPRRELSLYDGVVLLAIFVVSHHGTTRAFGADRRSLGSFPTLLAATAAVNANLQRRGGAA